jgi:hypothetical protein
MWERPDLRAKLVGLKVGKLIVIEFHEINKNGHTTWLTECECGNTKIVVGKEFKRGKVKKCNICHIEEKRQRAITHGESKSKLYNMWHCMKYRCDNENGDNYKNYGGRGITYDSKWKDYLKFKKDMLDKYKYANRKFKDDLPVSLERMNVNGNYCKNNCCFIPLKQQAKNKRSCWRFWALSPEGIIYDNIDNLVKFAKEHNLTSAHISKCLRGERAYHKGWEFREIKRNLKSRKIKVNIKSKRFKLKSR